MGKIPQGILGALSSSVGKMTGAVVKGRPTLRRKSNGGSNPQTESQQANRGAFAEASEYCRTNRAAIVEYLNLKEKKGVSIWNQMVSWYLAGGRLPSPVVPDWYVDGDNHLWYCPQDWYIDTSATKTRAAYDTNNFPRGPFASWSYREVWTRHSYSEGSNPRNATSYLRDGIFLLRAQGAGTSSLDWDEANFGAGVYGDWLDAESNAWSGGIWLGVRPESFVPYEPE